MRHRQPVPVGLVGQGDTVVRLGQELAQGTEGGPVDEVAHVLAQWLAEMSLCGHVLGKGDGKRRRALQ